jgi:hypothetical protein
MVDVSLCNIPETFFIASKRSVGRGVHWHDVSCWKGSVLKGRFVCNLEMSPSRIRLYLPYSLDPTYGDQDAPGGAQEGKQL